MITASFFTIEMRGKTENIHNTIFTQFTTFLSIMSLYVQSKYFLIKNLWKGKSFLNLLCG